MQKLITDILVVGGGVGATAAAISAARRGVDTIIVSEFSWLGGMLTSAGVAVPDGNELAAWQTGLWGAFIRELKLRQKGGLDRSWVSMFAYDPRTGAEIFTDWVKSIPNLQWIGGQTAREVIRKGNKITGVNFSDFSVTAKVIIDGTELGDILALADVPHRWGWEWRDEYNEPSAPICESEITRTYPVQSPTWVVVLQDFGAGNIAPQVPISEPINTNIFAGAWETYGGQKFLNYGKLSDNLFMINWPICGNDYGKNLNRLIGSIAEKQEYLNEAYSHSLAFARYIQDNIDRRYGLAEDIFPHDNPSLRAAFALHPYYRESRRLQGMTVITEKDILPIPNGRVAKLPTNEKGEITSIAIGNYANDHHYPDYKFELQPKSTRWGGRWTGTPFTIPYTTLVPVAIDGLLVCEKNISVSHIANGSTRLQPCVFNIGQAAGTAAALAVELSCQPRDVKVRTIQEALLTDKIAPAAVIPLFNLPPEHPDWSYWQSYYLDRPEAYPIDGNCPCLEIENNLALCSNAKTYTGKFKQSGDRQYSLITDDGSWGLVTLRPEVDRLFQELQSRQNISIVGTCNYSGRWLVAEKIEII
jgi:hypothetical protein